MAFTPSLVGLANELEGKPFHLIASYNQRGTAKTALHEAFENGVDPLGANVTATLQSRHPGVTGIRYVPYYLVFDHHGDLVYHHQGGPYHGGDRKAVLQRVRKMLTAVPAIYVGKAAYSTHAALARKIESGKQLGKQLEALGKELAASPDDAELARLVEAVERNAGNAVAAFQREVPRNSKAALQALGKVAKAYEGTPWGAQLLAAAKAAADRGSGKRHATASKKLQSARSLWGKLQAFKGNGSQVRNPIDKNFRSANDAALKELRPLLTALATEYPELPAGQVASRWLQLLKQ
ncbi:MAG: hypothetical protein AAF581_06835 [Planctomycetota bacterium]